MSREQTPGPLRSQVSALYCFNLEDAGDTNKPAFPASCLFWSSWISRQKWRRVFATEERKEVSRGRRTFEEDIGGVEFQQQLAQQPSASLSSSSCALIGCGRAKAEVSQARGFPEGSSQLC